LTASGFDRFNPRESNVDTYWLQSWFTKVEVIHEAPSHFVSNATVFHMAMKLPCQTYIRNSTDLFTQL
jgi:hypothetical protein